MQEKKYTLKSTHVEENELTSHGVEFLASAVLPLLQYISLATNQCWSSGAQAWIAAHDKMRHSKLLYLAGKAIPDHIMRELETDFREVLVDIVDW